MKGTFKEFEVSVKNQEDNDFTLLFSTNEYMLIGSLNRLLNISLTENSSKQHKYQVRRKYNLKFSKLVCKRLKKIKKYVYFP